MEIDVSFVCPCGAFVEETISCSGPDLTAERHRDAYQESWETLVCDGCSKDFETHIMCSLLETTVAVAGAVDLSWEVQPEFDDAYLIWEIESTQQLEIFKKVTKDVVTLLRMDHPAETQATLHNMLYAQVVTAVEAYLAGICVFLPKSATHNNRKKATYNNIKEATHNSRKKATANIESDSGCLIRMTQ